MSMDKRWEKVAREKGLVVEDAARRPPQLDRPPVVRFDKPPTTNNLFLSAGRKRVKTPEYRAWIERNKGEAARLAPPSKFPVRACYRLCGKFNTAADGANYEKPTIDLLVSVGVLPDDKLKYVTGGRWEYAPSSDEPHVLVWLEVID
jgi:hypothetical protein